MREVRVMQRNSGVRVASRVKVAESWWRRLKGLLFSPPLTEGEGLLLLGCASVHTVGMAASIDVVFLDREGRVVRRIDGLRPWRVGWGGGEAVHALELPAGRLDRTGTLPGARLSWS